MIGGRQFWRSAKRFFLFAGGILVVGGGIFFLLRPKPVTVSEVVVREVAPAVHGVGTVEAKVVVQIGAKIAGRIVSIYADQGDSVKAGHLLVQLEDSQHAAEVRQADATLDRAKLLIAAQEASLRKARSALLAAEATVSRVRATEALARLNRERWHKLYADGLVARADVDARETEASAAAEDLKNVIAQREAAFEEVALIQANLEAARQDIRVAASALNTVRVRQADTVVTSPLDGFVVSRELEPGATVNPGTPILRIADPRSVWVTVHVDERSSGAIAVGDRAEISLRSQDGRTLRGHVSRIRRESDRVTEQLAVDVSFEERPARLTLGEQAEATISSAARRTGPAFPLAALVRTPDGPAALVVKDGRIEFRNVKVGISDPAGWVEALEGVRPGELVVITPGRLGDRASDGIRVAATRNDGKLPESR